MSSLTPDDERALGVMSQGADALAAHARAGDVVAAMFIGPDTGIGVRLTISAVERDGDGWSGLIGTTDHRDEYTGPRAPVIAWGWATGWREEEKITVIYGFASDAVACIVAMPDDTACEPGRAGAFVAIVAQPELEADDPKRVILRGLAADGSLLAVVPVGI